MHINVSNKNIGRITVPANKIFDDTDAEGTFGDTVKDIYYSRPETSERLTNANLAAQAQYRLALKSAVDSGALTQEQADLRARNFDSGNIGPWNPQANTAGTETLRDLENTRFCLNHVPQQCADGLYRPMDFYVAPGTLNKIAEKQNWEMSDEGGEKIPVADAVVVGAGPGGLSTAWQLARRGGRVVCFESELAGSAFSDNTAKPVHHMRTSVSLTNLAREGYIDERFQRKNPISLDGNIADYRTHARAGRDSQLELTGMPIHGVPEESLSLEDRHSPALRGELYEHLSSMAYSLANEFDDAILAERSPVNGITYKDGLYTVTTSRGHKVKARHLVMSTGLTGPQGERGKMLPVFDQLAQSRPGDYLLLGKDGDSVAHAQELEELASHHKEGLVINDRLLGDQAVRQTLASLPDGTRAAVVGSGESAIKGALELLHLHPGLKVDLFVKEKLESAQVQLPIENFHPAVLEATIDDPAAKAPAEATFKEFGTPVTPRSLQEFLEFQQAGRARLIELDGYFSQDTMDLTAKGEGKTTLHIKDPEMAKVVAERCREYESKGLMPQSSIQIEGSEYGAFIQSIGYSKLKPADNPLLKLGEEAQKKIHINTAGSANHPAQTSMPGLSTEGRHLAERIASEIPDDRRIDLPVHDSWRDTDPETVQGVIHNRGLHPNFVKDVEDGIARDGHHPQELRLIFTADDTRLRDIAAIPEDQRTPAQQETLDRGYLLANKMKRWSEKQSEKG